MAPPRPRSVVAVSLHGGAGPAPLGGSSLLSPRTLLAGSSTPSARAVTAALAAALIGAAVASCARTPAPYLVGTAGPQTLAYGVQNQRGIQLAVEEINRAGGIDGHPIRLVVADDHATGADAA